MKTFIKITIVDPDFVYHIDSDMVMAYRIRKTWFNSNMRMRLYFKQNLPRYGKTMVVKNETEIVKILQILRLEK